MISLVKIIKEDMDAPPPAIVRQEPDKPSSVLSREQIMDAYVVAATLWMEARGEGEHGMHAVLNVIMNRAKGDFSKAKEVSLKPKQFSAWNSISNPEQKTIQIYQSLKGKNTADSKAFSTALNLVNQALTGKLTDITDGATFYFNPKLANPSWAKKMKRTIRLGNHDFYKP
jgi:N-acetylmuramoyl-L-alanine amidase